MKKVKKNDKKLIFEMMGKIDPTYKKSINERFLTKGELEEVAEGQKPLRQIAYEIYRDWNPVSPYAKPYLEAMTSLDSVDDKYGMDDGRMIVAYFLSNANTWKGEKAREIKKELKKRIGLKEEVQLGKENIGELFGASKKKRDRVKQEKLEKAKQEIMNYNFKRLFSQPADSSTSGDWQTMKRYRLEDAKRAMPTVVELMPTLFDQSQGSANASVESGGRVITGIIPANWFFIRNNGFVDEEKAKKELIDRLDTGDHLDEKEEKWMQDAVKEPGELHKKLGIPQDENIPMDLINKKLAELSRKSEGDKTLSKSDLEFFRQLQFAKNAKKINK